MSKTIEKTVKKEKTVSKEKIDKLIEKNKVVNSKTATKEKTDSKAVKKEKKEQKPVEVTKVSYLDYKANTGQKGRTRIENVPQLVPDFKGKSKSVLQARAMLAVSLWVSLQKAKALKLNLIAELQKARKLEKSGQALKAYTDILSKFSFNTQDILSFFKTQFNIDIEKAYKGRFPDNPTHSALYRLSKVETRQARPNKEGKLVDSFAIGARELIRRDGRTGVNASGRYYLNPNFVEYYKIETLTIADARGLAKQLLNSNQTLAELIK